jgi:hypothetical protein
MSVDKKDIKMDQLRIMQILQEMCKASAEKSVKTYELLTELEEAIRKSDDKHVTNLNSFKIAFLNSLLRQALNQDPCIVIELFPAVALLCGELTNNNYFSKVDWDVYFGNSEFS